MTSAIKSQLSDNSKLLKMYYIENGSYPTSLDLNYCPSTPIASTQYCMKTLKNSTLTYTGSTSTFSLLIKDNSSGLAYNISENDNVSQVTTSEPSYVTSWSGSDGENASSITQTSDGGFIISGVTSSFGAGSTDAFIAKFDSNGTLSWDKTWGGASYDNANSLVVSSDNGYVIAGGTSSYGNGMTDAFIAKFDSNGNLAWDKTWGGANHDYADSITLSSDGGYVISGATRSTGAGSYDAFIAKFDTNGNLSWDKTWGGTDSDYFKSIKKTSDNGYVATGYTNNFGVGDADSLLVKFDSNGNLSWNRTWGASDGDYAKSIIQTTDNGYAITGSSYSFSSGNSNIFLAKFDSTGSLMWDRAWGGATEYSSDSIIQLASGEYVVVGSTYPLEASMPDAYIAKYSIDGDLIWNQTWGGSQNDYYIDITELTEGGYAIAGYTDSFDAETFDVLLFKTKSDGTITNCASPICQSPVASVSIPNANTTIPSVSLLDPSISLGSPDATSTSTTAKNLVIVAP